MPRVERLAKVLGLPHYATAHHTPVSRETFRDASGTPIGSVFALDNVSDWGGAFFLTFHFRFQLKKRRWYNFVKRYHLSRSERIGRRDQWQRFCAAHSSALPAYLADIERLLRCEKGPLSPANEQVLLSLQTHFLEQPPGSPPPLYLFIMAVCRETGK